MSSINHLGKRSAQKGNSFIEIRQLFVLTVLAFTAFCVLGAPIPSGKPSNFPNWWFERNVIVAYDSTNNSPVWPGSYPASDDYSVINQGQFKNLASQAYNELQFRLPLSVWSTTQGKALTTMVTAWDPNGGDGYLVLNAGQLKTVAKAFYDVLTVAGYPNSHTTLASWQGSGADDFSVINIGQVKNLFCFDLSLVGPSNLTVTDGTGGTAVLNWTLPAVNNSTSLVIQKQNPDGTWTNITTLANPALTTYTVTGLTEGQNYVFQVLGAVSTGYSVPTSVSEAYHASYYAGTPPTLVYVSGNNQTVAASTFLAAPLIVKVTNSSSTPLVSAPVTFTLAVGSSGGLSATSGGTTSLSVSVVTNGSGNATVYYKSGTEGVANNVIVASAGSTGVTFNFKALCGVQSGILAWFKADSGVSVGSGSVTNWIDQTGIYPLSTSAGTTAPTTGLDLPSGQPVLLFNGSQSISSSATFSGLTDVTIFAVASTPPPAGSGGLIALGVTTTNPTRGLGISSGSQTLVDAWSGTTPLVHNGGFVDQSGGLAINTVTYSGTVATFYSNGAANGTASGTSATVGGTISVGSLPYLGNWNGSIAEVLVYNRVLTSTERKQVEATLAQKYRILPVITSPLAAAGTTGAAFSYTITASNGATSFGAGVVGDALLSSLGLAVNSTTGVVSGTPSFTGSTNLMLSATSPIGIGTANLALTVVPASVPVISSSTVANGVVGEPFHHTILASNLPTSYAVTTGTLPGGLSLNTTSGAITGTPTGSGTTSITISATNSYGTVTKSLSFFIGDSLATIMAANSIAAPKVWFNGNLGLTTVNGGVTQWNDQGTGGFTASKQTGIDGPTTVSDPNSGNTLINFNGSQLLANTSTSVVPVTDMTMITVAGTQTAGTGIQAQVTLGNNEAGTSRVMRYQDGLQTLSAGQLTYQQGGPAMITPDLSINTVTFLGASPAAVAFYSQGVNSNPGASPTLAFTGLDPGLSLGSGAKTLFQTWFGNLGEVLIYNGVLSSTQRQGVEQYLANKYGVYAPNAAWISGYSSAVQTKINWNQWNKKQADNYVALQTNNPTMLTDGLKLWLKADAGVSLLGDATLGSAGVSAWADQTGNYVVTPPSNVANGQPTYTPNSSYGKPAVHFDVDTLLSTPTSLGVGINADMTIVVVGTPFSSPTEDVPRYGIFLGNGAPSDPGRIRSLGYYQEKEYYDVTGTSPQPSASPPVLASGVSGTKFFSSGMPAIQIASVNNLVTSCTFYYNGVTGSNPTLTGAQRVKSGITVGKKWLGDISEILVYDHELVSTERDQLNFYLATKYGLYDLNATWITSSGYSSDVISETHAHRWNKIQADAYAAVAAQLPVAPGIFAWYKGDSGIVQDGTGKISGWKDSSVYHHDLSQTTTAAQPSIITDPETGKPVLHFDGSDSMDSTDSVASLGDLTIVTVASNPNPTPTLVANYLVSLGSASTLNLDARTLFYYFGNQAFGADISHLYSSGTVANTTALTTSAVTFLYSTGSIHFYKDGVANSPNATKIMNPLQNGITIGKTLYSSGHNWNGNIAEVLIYNRELTPTEIGQIQTYVNNKYVAFTFGAPTLSVAGPETSASRMVTLGGATGTAVIYYTLDGTVPTAASNLYSASFPLTSTAMITCAIFQSGVQSSIVTSSKAWVDDANHLGVPATWFTSYGLSVPANPTVLAGLMTPGGLTYLQAYQWGYNPAVFSSNGSGVSDRVLHDAGYAATDTDMDHDGLTNAQELVMGTDLFSADSDHDGHFDGNDFYPLDFTRWQAPSTAGDTVPPTITLTLPDGL